MAQNLTFEEAKKIAHELYEIELLSKKGEKQLLQELEKNCTKNKSDSIEKSFVLQQLVNMFQVDLMYRMGMDRDIPFDKNTRHNRQKSSSAIPTKEEIEEYEKLLKKMEEEFNKQEWHKIEPKIEDEDPQKSETKGFIVFPMVSRLKEHGFISEKRSVLGKTRTRTLNDLLKIGLIDSLVFEDVYKEFKNGNLSTEGYICSAALDTVEFYQKFENEKNKQIELINKLEKGNVISQSNKEKLINSYQKWELKKLYEFIFYCNNAKTFNLKEYSNDVEKAYKSIFEEMKEVIPKFYFQSFKIDLKIEKSSYGGLDTQNLIISFDVDSVHYTHSVLYDYLRADEKPDSTLKIAHNFHKIVNKFLSDQNSDTRLYFAEKTNNPNRDENEFGIILLTKEQRRLWKYKIESFYFSDVKLEEYYSDIEASFLSTEIHDNRFNTKNVEKIIAEYEEIGLFSHLSEAEIKEGKEKIKQNEISTYSDILMLFPKQIIFFDWESGNLENPYEELTQEFGEISRGKFVPTNIEDSFWNSIETRKKTCFYSFDFNGKTYKADLRIKSDWLAPHFMELIESAIKENNVDGKIYVCIDDIQAAGYIFLSKSQYEYLNKNQPELFPKYP
ncbi:hypothetical protein WAF17_11990 [Bernardetia sp. ABR2-2B]|uniref:hypothetical protein n=1 Tax=Bernardetia sp. ABR2-2B TaxID=3127472 RepID=UPI0030D1BBB7